MIQNEANYHSNLSMDGDTNDPIHVPHDNGTRQFSLWDGKKLHNIGGSKGESISSFP